MCTPPQGRKEEDEVEEEWDGDEKKEMHRVKNTKVAVQERNVLGAA